MGIFGPPDIQKLKQKRNTAALIKALEHKQVSVAYSACQALGELRAEEAVPSLSNIKSIYASTHKGKAWNFHEQDQLYQAGLLALMKINTPQSRTTIEGLLAEYGMGVKMLLAKNIHLWGADAFEPYIKILTSDLGIQSKETSEALKSEVYRGLDQIFLTEHLVPVERVKQTVSHPNFEVRKWAEHALVASGAVEPWRIETHLGLILDESAIPELVAKLTDEHEGQQSAALEGLKKLGWTPQSDEEKAALAFVRKNWQEAVRLGKNREVFRYLWHNFKGSYTYNRQKTAQRVQEFADQISGLAAGLHPDDLRTLASMADETAMESYGTGEYDPDYGERHEKRQFPVSAEPIRAVAREELDRRN